MKVVHLPLEQIGVGRDNVRKTFKAEALEQLKDQIRARKGLLVPLGVTELKKRRGKHTKLAKYVLTDGFRRYRCLQDLRAEGCKLIDFEQIPCSVREGDSLELAFVNLNENTHEKVHAYEVAKQLRKIKVDYGLSEHELADESGYSLSYVRKCLKSYEKMIPEIRTYFERRASGKIKMDDARLGTRFFFDVCSKPKEKQEEIWKDMQAWEATKPRKRTSSKNGQTPTSIRARVETLLVQAKEKKAPGDLIQLLGYLLGQADSPPSPLSAPKKKQPRGF